MISQYMHIAAALTLTAAVGRPQAATPNQSDGGMRYLGEVGHLGTEYDRRISANLGIAKAISTDSSVRFEGKDDRGKRWSASVEVSGGVGWTDTWISDFDHNSRQDLLIAASFPANGRCVDPVHLTFLMMDSAGRPVPWSIHTRWPKAVGEGKRPALMVDFNRNGRAELVVTDCEYELGTEGGANRRITGVYEAKDAHWRLMLPRDLSPYQALFRANYRETSHPHLLAPKEADSTNLGNESLPGAAPLTLKDMQPPTPECSHTVNLPPVVNGRLVPLAHDPCDELKYNRLMFSNGSTCYSDSDLTIMVDRPDGREIISIESKKRVEATLRELIKHHAEIVLAGQRIPGKCSPVTLWATEQGAVSRWLKSDYD